MNICLTKSFKELLYNKFKKGDFKDSTSSDKTKNAITELATKLDKSNSKLQSAFQKLIKHKFKLGNLVCKGKLLECAKSKCVEEENQLTECEDFKTYEAQMAAMDEAGASKEDRARAGECAREALGRLNERRRALDRSRAALRTAVQTNAADVVKYRGRAKSDVVAAVAQLAKVFVKFVSLRTLLEDSVESVALERLTFWEAWEKATVRTYLGQSFDDYVAYLEREAAGAGWDAAVEDVVDAEVLSDAELNELGLVVGGFKGFPW